MSLIEFSPGDPLFASEWNANFSELESLRSSAENYIKNFIPVGFIVMWSGEVSSLPLNWALCDGTNGTPDLREKFIVGAGLNYNLQDEGGESEVTLTVANLPPHAHPGDFSFGDAGAHTHSYTNRRQFEPAFSGSSRWRNSTSRTTSESGAHTHPLSGVSDLSGGEEPHNNLPPYLTLAYIQKISNV